MKTIYHTDKKGHYSNQLKKIDESIIIEVYPILSEPNSYLFIVMQNNNQIASFTADL